MARPKAVNPNVQTKVYLTPANAALLQLAAFSPLRGKTEYGEVSRIINLALEQYFTTQKETPDVQPPDSRPA